MMGGVAATALALSTLAVVAGSRPHNFTGDYLIGSWNCTIQAANGLAVKRTTYKLGGGGAWLQESGTTTTAQGRTLVEDTKITDNSGSFRWVDIYTGRGWQTSVWWNKGAIHLEDFFGSGKTLTLKQVTHAKYTAEVDSLMNPPVVSTCLRR
jgi:hypothetical protein